MEELSRECLMETLDVFSGLKRIGGSEDELSDQEAAGMGHSMPRV